MWTMRLLGRVLALTSWVTSLEGLLAAHPGAFGQRFLLGTRLAQCDANRSVPDKTNPFTSIAARFQMMRGGDSASPRVPRVPHIFATSLRAGAGASVEEDLIPARVGGGAEGGAAAVAAAAAAARAGGGADAGAAVPPAGRAFLVNGWRWHARAVLRDLGRFQAVAEGRGKGGGGGPPGEGGADPAALPLAARQALGRRLVGAHAWVWGFSWAGLARVEGELFFPWLRARLPPRARPLLAAADAERRLLLDLGEELGAACAALARGGRPEDLAACRALAADAHARFRALVAAQEEVVVPYVAAHVPARDQKRFNTKVIGALGLLTSQVHLVSMADAVAADPEEAAAFRAQIPAAARALIPVWRRRYYTPKARFLELCSSNEEEQHKHKGSKQQQEEVIAVADDDERRRDDIATAVPSSSSSCSSSGGDRKAMAAAVTHDEEEDDQGFFLEMMERQEQEEKQQTTGGW